jgi:RimJ/RimL family protein N-acetyltransferase
MAGRRPTSGDLAHYERLLLDPAVGAHLRPPPLQPFDDAAVADLLRADLAHWAAHGFGPWLLEDPAGAFVGRGGLAWTTVGGEFAVELPWAIVPERWGEGLATEAARAAIAWARALGLEEVVSFTLPGNAASRRVMEHAGLRLDSEIEHAGLAHVLYRLRLLPARPG